VIRRQNAVLGQKRRNSFTETDAPDRMNGNRLSMAQT
jgi:hypothetical protein